MGKGFALITGSSSPPLYSELKFYQAFAPEILSLPGTKKGKGVLVFVHFTSSVLKIER